MKRNAKTQIGVPCSIFVKIIGMKEFKNYINCYLDTIEKIDKKKYQDKFPWVNDKLFNEQWQFWLGNKLIDVDGNVIKRSNKQKLIFLDVDGVLNHSISTDAIDAKCLENLREIVKQTNSLIILISSWKSGWNKNKKEQFDSDANYLDERLKEVGLSIFDKSSRNAYPRCFEVADWLVRFNTNKYVVLDDDWGNYGNTPIKEKLIRCDYYDRGLTKELSLGAIKLLNP